MTKRAGIYYRISRDRTGAEAGIRRQEHDCRALVEARGWVLGEEFTDNDLSAYSGKPRPAFERLLDEVRSRRVDVVVAWHPDRLVRNPRELEDVIDVLDAARCPVETVRAGRWDLSTRSGRTNARLIGTVARDESEAKSERLRAMHEAKARAGAWKGGPRPYGYQPTDGALVVVEAEAEVIREAARRVLAGESLHGIATDLNARNVPTARGGAWRTPTLRRILTGATAAGRREYRGEDVGPAAWPAILDTRTHRRLAGALDGRGRPRGRVARVSLLAGIARCGRCGHELATQRRSSGVRVYVCPARSLGGCGGTSIVAEPVDDLVAAAVVARLDGPALADALTPAESGDADPSEELADIEADLAALAADLGAGRITRAEWLAARAEYEARREALVGAVDGSTSADAVRPYVGRPGALSEAWPDLSLDQRRAIVGAVVDTVPISAATRRGPGFDPGRVAVRWRA